MTVNALKLDVLRVCKYCRHFTDKGKWCARYNRAVHKAGECRRTRAIRRQAEEGV